MHGVLRSDGSLNRLLHRPLHLHRLLRQHRCTTKAFIALFLLLSAALSASQATETQESPNATDHTRDSHGDSSASTPTKPPKITPFNFTLYHSSDALLRKVRALAARHPHAAELKEITIQSSGGYTSTLTAVTLHCDFAQGAAIGNPSVRSASDAGNKGTGVPGAAVAADGNGAIAMGVAATANGDVATANSGGMAVAREAGEATATAADEGAFSGFGGDAHYFMRLEGRSNASCSSVGTIEGFSTVLPAELSGKLRILLVFGQHGREAITTELGFNLLKVLVGEREVVEKIETGKSDEPGGGEEDKKGEEKEVKSEGREEETEVEEEEKGEKEGEGKEGTVGGMSWEQLALIWPHLVITVVPMENVNGRNKVEAGKLCERRNGRGVDINRNWDCDWGVKEKDYNPLEEAPGTHAFSEPEAEAMRRLAVWFRPHVWVNVHSGMEALFTPLDHRGDGVDGSTLAAMHALLEHLDATHCGARCVIGSGGGFVG
ncbi:unnamed protein product [Closterium sp. Yama58-4]|nr:unnamed protein product [Closterium sp. Yama58-4]